MDILLFRIAGLLQSWEILCPPEKDQMKVLVKNIKRRQSRPSAFKKSVSEDPKK
jgi:hypothetical protein